MAGYRILKAMEGSEAPIYVVVKSFAASMAATITTLARKIIRLPKCYHSTPPNQPKLHVLQHEPHRTKRERRRLEEMVGPALPIPLLKKMGITSDEFIEMMYKKKLSQGIGPSLATMP